MLGVLIDDPRPLRHGVVALPRLVGRPVPGLPRDRGGFIPVDGHGRVTGMERVWAGAPEPADAGGGAGPARRPHKVPRTPPSGARGR